MPLPEERLRFLADLGSRLTPSLDVEAAIEAAAAIAIPALADGWVIELSGGASAARSRRIGLDGAPALVLPLAARGRTLGTLGLAFRPGRVPSDNLIDLAHMVASRLALAIDAGLLLEEERAARRVAEQASRRLDGLRRIVAALAEEPSFAGVTDRISRVVADATGADQVLFAIARADGREYELAGPVNVLDDTFRTFRRFPADDTTPLSAACHRDAPIFIDDPGAIVAAYPAMAPVVRDHDAHALAALPLRVRGVRIGALGLGWSRPHSFTDDERTFIEALAVQCATVLDRSRLFDQERASREQAELAHREETALLRLTELANRATAVDEVYEPALDALTTLLGVERASILLFDPDDVMRFKAWRGLSDAYRRAVEGHSPWTRDAVDPDAIVVPDCKDDPALAAYAPVFEAERIRALAFIPISHAGELLGKFMAYDKTPRRFSARELELARAIAIQVAQAVARGRLLERERAARVRAERYAERTQRLQRVAMRLSRALDRQEIADAIVGTGHETLGAYSTGLWSVSADGAALEMLASRNYRDVHLAEFSRIPLEPGTPLPDAVLGGEPIWMASRAAYAERYPAYEAKLRGTGPPGALAFACLPLRAGDHTLGAVALTFTNFDRPAFDDDDRAFLSILAQHCAQALDRARSYEEAVRAIAVRDEFLSIAGHELKTPLTALTLQSEAIVQRGADQPVTRLVERIEKVVRHSHRLARLVDELLDVSRITAGRLNLHREEVDLGAVVADNLARVVDDAGRAGSEVRLVTTGAAVGAWDRMRLDQVVTNLLTNAIKYGAGKPVDVRVERTAAAAVLVVRDHGIGIPPDDQRRIFERFERAVPSRHFGGLGLGLWIARQIVEAHGGTIAVQSVPGEGAEFRVELPLRP